MKRKRTLVLLAAASVAGVVHAGTITTTPYVAGDFNGWDAAGNVMTETAPGSGIWTLSLNGFGASEKHEFKVTDGTWGINIPAANSWFYTDGAGDITITYDANTYADGWSSTTDRIGLNVDPGAWNVTGDFLSEIGGADWSNNDAAGAMTDMGGGIYSLTVNDLATGDYLWKAVVNGTWDSISWDSRSVGTADWSFSTDAVNNDVTFYVDALTGTAKIEVIPEPATMGLVGMFGAGLMLFRRRFRI